MALAIYSRYPMALVFTLLSSLCVVSSMDHHNFNYSMKCVPIPSEEEYKLQFLHSIHKLDKNMRWRAFHFLNPDAKKNSKETYGLNSTSAPPPIKELRPFQEGLAD